ncbi:MAG: hypothetical protein R3303_15775, partial [Marinobacter sp.]|nr:hypothetical protein [Marinobacter sp.]
LEKMAPVANADPVRVTADQMTLKVEVNGEVSQLEQYVALEPRFVRVESEQTTQNVTGSSAGDATTVQSAAPGPADNSGARAAEGQSAPAGNAPSKTDTTGQTDVGTGPSDAAGSGVRYRPYVNDNQPAEESFESLYPTLHYRWQGSGVIAPAGAAK